MSNDLFYRLNLHMMSEYDESAIREVMAQFTEDFITFAKTKFDPETKKKIIIPKKDYKVVHLPNNQIIRIYNDKHYEIVNVYRSVDVDGVKSYEVVKEGTL